jgi:hypothetical protein
MENLDFWLQALFWFGLRFLEVEVDQAFESLINLPPSIPFCAKQPYDPEAALDHKEKVINKDNTDTEEVHVPSNVEASLEVWNKICEDVEAQT